MRSDAHLSAEIETGITVFEAILAMQISLIAARLKAFAERRFHSIREYC
jgi:hypothetical protein